MHILLRSMCAADQGLDDFQQGIASGFLLIFFSELGDKTFFIALLLALKQSKTIVFIGTFGALAIMTVISVRSASFVGWLATHFRSDQHMPRPTCMIISPKYA